jgi:hypothetical protein
MQQLLLSKINLIWLKITHHFSQHSIGKKEALIITFSSNSTIGYFSDRYSSVNVVVVDQDTSPHFDESS